MVNFTDYICYEYLKKTNWNVHNLYCNLTQTADNILRFDIPSGINCQLSSLTTPNFVSKCEISAMPILNGSLSYIYSNVDLDNVKVDPLTELQKFYEGYRHVDVPFIHYQGELEDFNLPKKSTLLYGCIFLPSKKLDAIFARRLSPWSLFSVLATNEVEDPDGGTMCFQWQHDTGKRSLELMYETTEAMIGLRALWNLNLTENGMKKRIDSCKNTSNMCWSLGFETYYGVLTKCAGASLGMRLHSGPSHLYSPFILTCTLNPIVGHITSTFSTAEPHVKAFSVQYDFNLYSYESKLQIGAELWRGKFFSKTQDENNRSRIQSCTSVLKSVLSTTGEISLLWQARIRNFLLTLGTTAHITKIDPLYFGIHLEYAN
ncbi:Mdm10/Mdm12/Mmm1 complex subunit Mdm10 [Schizosaccharomyces octosporus yFS286]|uniref:Mitochondrial distribution and morphology protein 10 n=1 Tax=Schizosaccharomyces octosporus (strain yFS286) TaxID=483514 RepID=S9R8W7_SCHOY|nr:Mdm10/Mdm12/Mmm1 complex subunit Mdm10 [Schizosaccharomyces octosporus yFS286]EPX70544.1 Mdm10/Mdm12/Mmm1 complex subunit Mdm10 [Schizosaccharomyces octosporus yFS286]